MSEFDTTTARPQTLFDIAGIQARIHTLPGRPPFMLAGDIAEVYGTEYRRVTEALKRNPDIFPEDFAFYLTIEEGEMLPKNSATSQGKRTDLRQLVFIHPGAYGLSAVIKSATASKMHVAVHRAFAAMEAAAAAQAQKELLALHSQLTGRRSLYSHVRDAFREGRSFQEVKDETRRSQREIMERMATVMINCGYPEPLQGTPERRFLPIWQAALNPDAPAPAEDAPDPRQLAMFGEG